MSDLTGELNLALAIEEDDTSDYLTIGLRDSLNVVDGLFNSGTGHAHNGAHQGGTIDPASFADNSMPGAKLIDGTVTAAKLAGIPDSLFIGSWVNTAANYSVASAVMYVFCTAGVTVTLPSATSTNRPITIIAVTGQSAVNAVNGGVIGGSVNTSSGAIMNGVITQGDSLTYKSDGTNWRVV